MPAILLILVLSSCSVPSGGITIHDDPVNAECPHIILQIADDVTEGWTDTDTAQVEISRKRCKTRFGDKSCLRKLTKVGKMRYTATCRSY